ncbi:MAG: DNA polymerase III subunit delta, partial [candidate division GAL15 bacterium]
NLDRLDAGELDVFELLTRLDTLPFFGPARVVVVQEVHRMPAPAQERLASHLEAGPPASVVVLEAASLDRRRRLWNVVQRVGEVVEADRVDDRRAVAWVASRVRELGKRITGDAARALGAAVGTDLQALASEVEKLVAYAHEDATVELAHVEAVASHGAEVSVFALTDAVARGEAAQALRVLHRLLQRENPVALVALLRPTFGPWCTRTRCRSSMRELRRCAACWVTGRGGSGRTASRRAAWAASAWRSCTSTSSEPTCS